MHQDLSDEKRKDILEKYDRNCDMITEAPKVNLEIQRHLSGIARKRDQDFLDTQNYVGSAIIALEAAASQGMDYSTEMIDFEKLMRYMWDAGKFLADVFFQQPVARKSFITPVLEKEMKTKLDATTSDEWLYGEKLTEQVRRAKSIAKAAATLKTHGKNKYWKIYMTECSTFRYVQKLLKTRSTALVQLNQ